MGLHRGLVESEPDTKMAVKHIVKAEHNLKAALYFEQGGYSDWSMSAFFYCLYHCFLAILRKYGYESRNQECTLTAIETLTEEGKINLDSKFIDMLKIAKVKETDYSVIKMREDFQYGVELNFQKKDEFNELIKICRELIEITKEIIHK
jgi:uncharacterized protein (UPF0332 family)